MNKDRQFEDYKQELNNDNLTSFEDLERITSKLVKKATKIIPLNPSRLPEDSQKKSHFGGLPYFEVGEVWPMTKKGKHLDFIFQIFNEGNNSLPDNVKLVQFFYNWEKFPWSTGDEGWLVKVYDKINIEQIISIDRPNELEISKYCEINFQSIQSLPDWESIGFYNDKILKLSCILNENCPWDSYDKVVEKLIGKQNYQSQIGGYPKWVQGESIPEGINGESMNLLFQIDSENNAGLMWGDTGLIYVFYDEISKQVDFTLQCY